jgi:hypothetical protein
MTRTPTVIPAKAGIQLFFLTGAAKVSWTPAFAGVTKDS